jgi:hypothetical protein
MIALQSVEEIEFNETEDLFFHRLGECKLPSSDSCFAISKYRGVIFIGTGTGASTKFHLLCKFGMNSLHACIFTIFLV